MKLLKIKISHTVYFCLLLLSYSPLLSFRSNSCIEGAKQQHSKTNYKSIALSYVGITDNGNNTGKEVGKFQRFVHIPSGSPWCAAFVSYVLAKANIIYPRIVSALARRFKTHKSIRAIRIYQGIIKSPFEGLAIWVRGNTIHGHIGIMLSKFKNNKAKIIEGNTKIKDNIDGVAIKMRKIEPYNYFRIVWITPIQE